MSARSGKNIFWLVNGNVRGELEVSPRFILSSSLLMNPEMFRSAPKAYLNLWRLQNLPKRSPQSNTFPQRASMFLLCINWRNDENGLFP